MDFGFLMWSILWGGNDNICTDVSIKMSFHATFISTSAPLVEFKPGGSIQAASLIKLCSHLAVKNELRHLKQWRDEARAAISQSGTLCDIRNHTGVWFCFMLVWFLNCRCFSYSQAKSYSYCIFTNMIRLWYYSIRGCWFRYTVPVTLWSSTLQKLLV